MATIVNGQKVLVRGYGEICTYCKRELIDVSPKAALFPTRDHVVPRSKLGGVPGEIVWACRSCNQLKADRLPEQWARFMRRNPRWWEHPAVTGRPKVAPPAPAVLPIEHSRYILAHGKKAYKRWVEMGCPPPLETLRPLRPDEPIPIEYDDPIKQAAFEAAYRGRRSLLRVPREPDAPGQPPTTRSPPSST